MIRYEEVKTPDTPPNPKTGQDPDYIIEGGVETMQVNIVDRGGVTHDGDMGRLGKSE
jgi:hypothetical protein